MRNEKIICPAYVDIEPYTIGVNTFLAAVSDDNAEPFYFDEVEKMGLAIHDALQSNAVGYQFMVAQSGRVIYSRAGGLSRLSSGPLPPNSPLPMTTRTQHSLGSVSKMITSMTILRLVDQGKIDLYAPVSNYLPASDYPLVCNMQNVQYLPECWVKRIKVIDLLKHTSGVTKANAGCSAKDGEFEDITPPQVDCKNFFSAIQDSLPCDPVNGCKRSYNNSNVNALRKIIEYVINAEKGAGTVESSQDIVRETRLLWTDNAKVRLGAMTCQYGPYVYYYGPCEGAGDCYGLNGKSWLQYQPSPLWDESCSAGGWSASSREMIEFLFAIRYRHIFSSANNDWLSDLLLSAELKDSTDEPGSTALAWGIPWTAEEGGEKNLGKDGLVSSHGVGLSTYITRLPNNCDAVILVNTRPGNAESLLKGAYNYGKGITNALPNY
jgi:CubicO group peptidase (beta-lactamase class C family)